MPFLCSTFFRHTFTHNPKYIRESKDWWRRRNTQRCSLTRRKTKLLFAHFITKSGLIIITGVWELPYNLWKVLRITQSTPQWKRHKYKYVQLFPRHNTQGSVNQMALSVAAPVEIIHPHFYLLRKWDAQVRRWIKGQQGHVSLEARHDVSDIIKHIRFLHFILNHTGFVFLTQLVLWNRT